jgi:hypothetical protein
MKAGSEERRQWGQDEQVDCDEFFSSPVPKGICHFIPLFYSPTANSRLTQLNKHPTSKLVAS